VDRTLDILEYLSTHPNGLGLSELSENLTFPKNAVFRITAALRARGYITRDERTKRFTLTRKFLMLTQPRFEQKSLVEVAMEPMRKLRDITGETVQIGVRSGLEGVIIERVESVFPLRISVDIGLRFGFHNNAPGKLLLAHMPLDERERMIKSLDLAASTSRTITTPEDLKHECDRIAYAGYSTDYGEADEGIHCVAAPVMGPHNHLEAALWISGPARRLPKDSFVEKAQFVMQAAREISERLKS
jgi:DNA-binding IclR family transcriptional regulator